MTESNRDEKAAQAKSAHCRHPHQLLRGYSSMTVISQLHTAHSARLNDILRRESRLQSQAWFD
jgi:hypothetical protein